MLDDSCSRERMIQVRWTGDIDLASVDSFHHAIVDAASDDGDLCIDLRETTFIDSTGIGELVRAANAASARGFSLTVRAEQPAMRRVFWLMNLDVAMTFDPPLAEGDRHINPRVL